MSCKTMQPRWSMHLTVFSSVFNCAFSISRTLQEKEGSQVGEGRGGVTVSKHHQLAPLGSITVVSSTLLNKARVLTHKGTRHAQVPLLASPDCILMHFVDPVALRPRPPHTLGEKGPPSWPCPEILHTCQETSSGQIGFSSSLAPPPAADPVVSTRKVS